MIILTWNRDHEDVWSIKDYEKERKLTELGKSFKGRWSVGRHKNIPNKSELFFFVQGNKHLRGLVAQGITTSEPYSDRHWSDPKRTSMYVDIKLTSMLDLNDTIPVTLLEERLPFVPWRVIRQSGLNIKEDYQEALRELWNNFSGEEEIAEPGELKPREYIEGGFRNIKVNRYERDPQARRDCLAHFGKICRTCGIDLELIYGKELGATAIHVHHIKPMASRRKTPYKINPIKDLIPLCPNCHNIIHKADPVLSPDQLKRLYQSRNRIK